MVKRIIVKHLRNHLRLIVWLLLFHVKKKKIEIFGEFSIGFSSVIVAEMTEHFHVHKDYRLKSYIKFANFLKV